ncbi:MAG: Lrp/AsnC family transcriptional regulator [Candidatus ainarchaeum sp.]|nr:Lrp/AsnC family transcriptional regulator [Candidatus ainarchaeum sp.]
MGKAVLGETERKLLSALQCDSERSVRELAKGLGLPLSTAHEKISRLKREGVITKCCAVLDAEKAGFPATGFVFVTLSGPQPKAGPGARRRLAAALAALPEVQEAFFTSGESDMVLKVRAESVDSLGAFVSERLRALPGVGSARVEVVFRAVKEGTALPL